MSRPLRYFEPGTLMEVTVRTLQSMYLLTPGVSLNQMILGVLGRAQARYGIEIQLVVFLSNHYHMLCRPKDPQHLARVMCWVNSNLARKLGKMLGISEKVWGRRYRAIPVSDEPEAQIARASYLLAHGCKEGFVGSPRDWPGVHCIDAILEGKPLEGVWYDHTLAFAARRRGGNLEAGALTTTYQVVLSPLPCWAHLTPEQYRDRIAELVAGIESDAQRRQEKSGQPPLGAEFVRQQHPRSRPPKSKRTPAPLVHAASTSVRRMMKAVYRAFLASYREASLRLRGGDRSAVFPRYCFPPSLPFAAGP